MHIFVFITLHQHTVCIYRGRGKKALLISSVNVMLCVFTILLYFVNSRRNIEVIEKQ